MNYFLLSIFPLFIYRIQITNYKLVRVPIDNVRMISCDDMICTTYNFNWLHCCCLGAESSVFFIALSCAAVKKYANRLVPSWKQKCTARAVEKKKVPSLHVVEEILYRPVPLWKQKCTARAVEKKEVPSLPVVEEIVYRPVPSWKIICTVPSRRAKIYIPSLPVVTTFIYCPVPSWQFLLTVPSRRDNFYLPSRPVTK